MDFDFDFDRSERRKKAKGRMIKILVWVFVLALAIALAWAITEYAIEITNVVDNSMEITLNRDDRILVNKLAYSRNNPERFDVVVFTKSGKEHSYYSVKRIIGLPGETVQIKDGCVYINGTVLDEAMLTEPIALGGLATEELILDEDEYFVLGDNRNNSEDSRFANVGCVVMDEIVGKAWLRTNKFAIISKLNMNSKQDTEEAESTEKKEEEN